MSQKRFILTIELPHSICTPPLTPSQFPRPTCHWNFPSEEENLSTQAQNPFERHFSWQGLPLLCTSSILTHCLALYAVCSMHLHHFYHPHTMNVLLYISTMTSHEVLLLNVLLCTSISPHRMATDLPPPTSTHSLYSLAPKSNQRRICQQYPKYLKTKHRQKWRSS